MIKQKLKSLFTTFVALFLFHISVKSQDIWSGPKITFRKQNNANINLAANQDRLTDTVWITRGTNQGIFNIRQESSYSKNSSPKGTLWAFGTTSNLGSLTFDDWETTISSPPNMMNKDMVVFLTEDSIYIDIKFTAWTSGGNGGGFTYVRSTPCENDTSIIRFFCDSFTSPSKKYIWTVAGQYMDTLSNQYSCDSVISIDLREINNVRSYGINRCNFFILPFSKDTITASGIYRDTLKNGSYCNKDSIQIINVNLLTSPRRTQNISRCDSFISPSNKVYVNSGIYFDTIRNPIFGQCDSIIITNLTINKSFNSTNDTSVCELFILPGKGTRIQQSGFYADSLTTIHGCDSIINYNVTINEKTFGQIFPSRCDSFVSPSGKYTYFVSGNYSDTLQNFKGCDSIVTINLAILNQTQNLTLTDCDSLISPSGKYVYKNSGIYLDTLQSKVNACDSILRITLTINQSSDTSIEIISANKYYNSILDTNINNSTQLQAKITNFNGCDSVINYDVTIVPIDLNISRMGDNLTVAEANQSYQWFSCDMGNLTIINDAVNQTLKVTETGDYAVEVTKNGVKDTSECFSVDKLSNSKILSDNSYSLYPNPSNGVVFFETKTDGLNQVQIKDLNGRNILEKEFYYKTNFKNLPKGIYILMVKNMNNNLFYKLIVE